MNSLAYTSTYQMMYLFLDTVEGEIHNTTLNTSFEAFLVDLNATLNQSEQNALEAIGDCITDYYEATIETNDEIQPVLEKLQNTLKAFHQPFTSICAYAKQQLQTLIVCA